MLLPLLWRYLLLQYGKTLAITLVGFLLILLSTRLEEAARLVGLGSSVTTVLLYILYQIPYVCQIALPIATLIGALYLFQRLSSNNELTAARASGIGLFELIAPLMLLAGFLALFSFQVVFDLSVSAHLQAKKLEYEVREMQPLALLQNSRLLEARGIKLDMKGSLVSDKQAQDLIVAMPAGENGHTTLILAKKLASEGNSLHGNEVSVISTKEPNEEHAFDDLIIENSQENVTCLKDLSLFANKHRMWEAGNDLLDLRMLFAKRHGLNQRVEAKKYKEKNPKGVFKKIRKVDAELIRRFSLAFSIVTFTLVGAAFGCHIGRMNRRRRFLYVVLLVGIYLVCYLAAKSLETKPLTAIILYLSPHVLLILAAIDRLSDIQRGVEI